MIVMKSLRPKASELNILMHYPNIVSSSLNIINLSQIDIRQN